jgi:hypothetical protein
VDSASLSGMMDDLADFFVRLVGTGHNNARIFRKKLSTSLGIYKSCHIIERYFLSIAVFDGNVPESKKTKFWVLWALMVGAVILASIGH